MDFELILLPLSTFASAFFTREQNRCGVLGRAMSGPSGWINAKVKVKKLAEKYDG
ncbi:MULTISPECIES: hypothetical protein [Shewanella]|uniref:Uncharacterized protein n=1 Tax=Shewanella decolorationis TaxID=256839 RepID=A0A8A7QS30_9GAMM|nr:MULTISPECIES: hypothetical protein [Shewanella]QTM65137.2 hypothetical protein D0436_23490 [Shewanella decolorationis]